MTKEQEDYLKSKVGKLLSWATLEAIGIDIGCHKPGRPTEDKTCKECSAKHYAKGLCLSHYLKARHTRDNVRNDKGQRIGRKGQVLCEFEGCDYSMKRRVKAVDGKWYCSVHHKGEIMGDTGIEA